MFSCIAVPLAHDALRMRLREGIQAAVAVGLVVVGCGSRTDLLQRASSRERVPDGGVEGEGGEDGALPDGMLPGDERGPTPVPVCTGQLSQCLPPDAGAGAYTGAAVIKCQPEEYQGPWTLVLERLSGANWRMVQTQVVQEPGFGATFYDTSGPPTVSTYRVCAIADNATALCDTPFSTQGPPNCLCEPTTCYLNTACDIVIDNQCGGTETCGACANGMPCNEWNTCCPPGFYSDLWGHCVCAPIGRCPWWDWDPNDCSCDAGGP